MAMPKLEPPVATYSHLGHTVDVVQIGRYNLYDLYGPGDECLNDGQPIDHEPSEEEVKKWIEAFYG